MLSFAVLLGYAILLIAMGLLVSRRVRSADDFFVARHGLGAGLLFSTLLAANVGAGSTVGATGLGYRIGFSAWWWVGSAGIGSTILAFTIGPRIWRIARDHGLHTVGDFLEHRYDRRVRFSAAALLWIGSLSILAGQFIAVAWILNVTLGLSKPLGCGIAGAVTTAYFAAGGLHSSARVNVVQLVVKMVGFLAAFFFLLQADGRTLAPGTAVLQNSFGWPDILRYLLILSPAFIVSPGILQKLFAARSASVVRTGVLWNAAGLLLFAGIPAYMGTFASTRFVLANPELALPTLSMQVLPLWLGGLLLGAVFSAELSAADAVLFMLTTSLTKDLYLGLLRTGAGEKEMIRFARWMALACGFAGVLIGILLPTVISALTIFYTLLTAALFLPIVAGIYSERVTSAAALATMATSVAVTIASEVLSGGAGLMSTPSLGVGLISGAAVLGILTLRKSSQSPGRRRG